MQQVFFGRERRDGLSVQRDNRQRQRDDDGKLDAEGCERKCRRQQRRGRHGRDCEESGFAHAELPEQPVHLDVQKRRAHPGGKRADEEQRGRPCKNVSGAQPEREAKRSARHERAHGNQQRATGDDESFHPEGDGEEERGERHARHRGQPAGKAPSEELCRRQQRRALEHEDHPRRIAAEAEQCVRMGAQRSAEIRQRAFPIRFGIERRMVHAYLLPSGPAYPMRRGASGAFSGFARIHPCG